MPDRPTPKIDQLDFFVKPVKHKQQEKPQPTVLSTAEKIKPSTVKLCRRG